MLGLNKKYKKIKQEDCVAVFEGYLDEKETVEAEANAVLKLQSAVSLPGFRQGKVPPQMIRQQFPSMVKEEALDIAARSILNAVLSQEKIYPVVPPKISDVSYEPGKKISLKLTLETNPKFEPQKYEKIKVTKKIKKVSDEDVDNYIKGIREYNAYLKSVPQDCAVSSSHYVIVDYEMFENGVKAENGDVKGEIIDMSAPQGIAGMSQALLGAKKGETKEFETEFDGKKIKFLVKVNEIKEKVIPEIDDNFLASAGVKTKEELRENVRKILQNEADINSEREVIKQIEDSLIKDNKIPLPPTVVEQEIAELFEIFKKRANVQEPEKLNIKDYDSSLRPIAERNLRITYLLHNIAKKENITAGDEEFKKEMEKALSSLKTQEEKDKAAEMFENRKDYVIASIVENKTFEFIKSKAEIKEENA
ncbi:MAG: trigger factor [Elusimicrobia bacterium]|nr:trigger factor [Elusimicrobiota bacterium]